MIKKGIKQGSVFVLTTVLAFGAIVLPNVRAALEVDTTAECSLQINLAGCSFKELNNADPQVAAIPVTVDLYKIADIDVEGDYTAVSSLETLDFSELDSETSASDWEALALAAKAEVDAKVETGQMAVTATGATQDGVVTFTDLATGLYLVDAGRVLSDYYQYDFTPYLISLPNNYYYDTSDDTWVYDLIGSSAIGLKPLKSDRYGDLKIDKLLDAYNETIGGANFVFQIEGSKTDIDTGDVKVVYSDVIAMTFKNPGTDSLVIEDIPAGSVMTVTEVYSGAGYELTSDASKTVTILAENTVETDFVNTHNEKLNGGTGLVNTFSYNSDKEEWTHSAAEDSTP